MLKFVAVCSIVLLKLIPCFLCVWLCAESARRWQYGGGAFWHMSPPAPDDDGWHRSARAGARDRHILRRSRRHHPPRRRGLQYPQVAMRVFIRTSQPLRNVNSLPFSYVSFV